MQDWVFYHVSMQLDYLGSIEDRWILKNDMEYYEFNQVVASIAAARPDVFSLLE